MPFIDPDMGERMIRPPSEIDDEMESRILCRDRRRARRAVAQVSPRAPKIAPHRPSELPAILAYVTALTGVTREQLLSPGGRANRSTKRVAHAMHEVMWLLWMAGNSYCAIGRTLGGRNHATIIHGVKQHEKRRAGNGAA